MTTANALPTPRRPLDVPDLLPLPDVALIDPIDWNDLADPFDLVIWEKLASQFWLDTDIALDADKPSWATLTEAEQELTKRVFVGLTLLDTVQGMVGAEALKEDAVTDHEKAVFTNIAFMENVHAKSYSSVFSTLLPTLREIKDIFRWGRENIYLRRKQAIVMAYYQGENPLQKKAASTLLESFLFYSGFYLPLYWASQAKLTNTADLVSLIIRDEAVHGNYIGYKYQQALKGLTEAEQEEMHAWVISLLLDLMDNEYAYTEHLYDEVGLTEEVKTFLRWNANKALMNLGYSQLYADDECEVDPKIIAALNAPLTGATGDFFSGKNVYIKARREDLTEAEWTKFGAPARSRRRREPVAA